MQRTIFSQRFLSIADLFIFLLIGTLIYALVSISHEWRAEFQPVTAIDLSIASLPRYTLFSAIRGVVAYLISLLFTLIVGYFAAKSTQAEKIIIPLLDILQSIPVLGFLPGLVLGLIALFPHSNIGLELAALIMIFTGQVWNLTFSYYSSLKSIPHDLMEVSTLMGMSAWERLKRVELPFSAANLAWNSLLSMAGGWFFLSACEAFTLGHFEYRLPGVGAYMATAFNQGNTQAMILGVLAMISIIVSMDFLIWRPILAWVYRFRLEDNPQMSVTEPLMRLLIRESRLIRWLKLQYRRYTFKRRLSPPVTEEIRSKAAPLLQHLEMKQRWPRVLYFFGIAIWLLWISGIIYGSIRLFDLLAVIPISTWLLILRNTGLTLLRVFGALIISTLWAVPVGIWIGTSLRRIHIAQPIIQILASFPAPMLYPLALALYFKMGLGMGLSSMFLMLLGVQWYVLFNVLAGALRIPRELKDLTDLMEISKKEKWKKLFLPSVFPSLVTGWVTAAGGAWNASIVAEYVSYHGSILTTDGLGSMINAATSAGDFKLLAASLTIMVVVVILLNRGVWAPAYKLAQLRFRLEM